MTEQEAEPAKFKFIFDNDLEERSVTMTMPSYFALILIVFLDNAMEKDGSFDFFPIDTPEKATTMFAQMLAATTNGLAEMYEEIHGDLSEEEDTDYVQ